ncbi:histone acetyltransferase type b catalytic [Cystoisospora suis]|uniref:Histone acetyltransferase type b catalytic n=1 Tax=Cystoisospora suis TaxID=483139 RepID=A0A2C6L9H6_9APIC|nr:histone acetyltransferase type b catalytic [Cystoisospora suis]
MRASAIPCFSSVPSLSAGPNTSRCTRSLCGAFSLAACGGLESRTPFTTRVRAHSTQGSQQAQGRDQRAGRLNQHLQKLIVHQSSRLNAHGPSSSSSSVAAPSGENQFEIPVIRRFSRFHRGPRTSSSAPGEQSPHRLSVSERRSMSQQSSSTLSHGSPVSPSETSPSPESKLPSQKNEERRQGLRECVSRLDELFHLPHQQWLPRHASFPLGSRKWRYLRNLSCEQLGASERNGQKPAALSASNSDPVPHSRRTTTHPVSPSSSSFCSPSEVPEVLSAQEALLVAWRLAKSKADFQWCLKGLNLLINFGRLNPDWQLSDKLFALALHCNRRDEASQLLSLFQHFLRYPPSSHLLFALMDEAIQAGRPQEVRQYFAVMRENWQIPITPAAYVVTLRSVFLIPDCSPDARLKEAMVIYNDAGDLGVPLPSIAHQIVLDQTLTLAEQHLKSSSVTRESKENDDGEEKQEKEGVEEDEEGRDARKGITSYTVDELLQLAYSIHMRAVRDFARDRTFHRGWATCALSSSLPSFWSFLSSFRQHETPSQKSLDNTGSNLPVEISTFPSQIPPTAYISSGFLLRTAWWAWLCTRRSEEQRKTAMSLQTTGEERNFEEPVQGICLSSLQSSGVWMLLLREACSQHLQELSLSSLGSAFRDPPFCFLSSLSRQLKHADTPLERREARQALEALQGSFSF